MKIVINACYGGFSLSPAAMKVCGTNWAYDEDQRFNPAGFIHTNKPAGFSIFLVL